VVASFADGQSNEMSVKADLTSATVTTYGYKLMVANVFPYQMTQKADIKVYYGSTYTADTDFSKETPIFDTETGYSVQDYFESVRTSSGVSDEMRTLAEKGLDYGANAQIFFDGKTYKAKGQIWEYVTKRSEGLANSVSNPNNEIDATKPDLSDKYKINVVNNIEGLTFKNASLMLGTETSVKVYYEYSGNLTITASGQKCGEKTVVVDTDEKSATITGIKSFELNDVYTITVKAGGNTSTLTFSPYTYTASQWNNTSDGLDKLSQALTAYGDAAAVIWK
jgi:hypothetical protein